MDPYLEGAQWMSVHSALSVEIARQLTPLLPERYVARPNERIVVTMPEGDDDVTISESSIYPDAFISDIGSPQSGTTGTGLALAPSPLRVATVMPELVPHVTVEITDVQNRRLVTAIEVLSPTNKRGEGRVEYLEKRGRALRSHVHLVEIDLLRSGQRVPMQKPLPPYPYFVLVGRAEKRPMTEVWPIRLDESLPQVPIPLLPQDADAPLDLQRTLTAVYDTFRYDRTLDYAHPPTVPLRSEKTAKWIQERIAAWRASRTR
jgi:hypothetical protein